MKPENPAKLLELAIAHYSENTPENGLSFALQAAYSARDGSDPAVRRRALNVASAICVMIGDHADAIDYGLQSASHARELKRDDAMINALVNVATALTHIGLFEEAQHIAQRVSLRFAERSDCAEDVRLMLTTAAHNALCNRHYGEAAELSERAIAMNGEVSDSESANARLRDEFNWMKAAIELDEPSIVSDRMQMIRTIESAYPTARNQLNLRFAEALDLHYSQGATQAAVAELGRLRDETASYTPIHIDLLRCLVRLCKFCGDADSAAIFGNNLVAYTQEKQMARIRRSIANMVTLDPSVHNELERIATNAQFAFDLSGSSIYRIGKLAGMLAREVGDNDSAGNTIELATRLHDIGNIAVDGELLQRMGTLAPNSQARLAHHTTLGAELILECGNDSSLVLAANIARYHHEHWDGSGYPNRLRGESIPVAARIAAIAIAYDEATHQRTMNHPEAVQWLKSQSGTRFDPRLVKLFLPMIERLCLVHGDALDAALSVSAPKRTEAREARLHLHDLVPELTLLEDAPL
jgi:HD-GYP domain-containing protein (c-di-GMP phosphodiesterase class II)